MESNIEGYTGTQLTNVTISASGYTGTKISSGNNTNYTPVATLSNVSIESFNCEFSAGYTMIIPNEARGFYGANQDTPIQLFEKYVFGYNEGFHVDTSAIDYKHSQMYLEIFKNNGITEGSDMYYFLHQLKNHGCGYSAIVNLICDYYKDNPKAFEEIYGYPLYDTNSKGKTIINYDFIVLDFFLKTNEYGQADFSIRYDGFETSLSSITNENITVEPTPNDKSITTYNEKMSSGEYDYAVVALSEFTLVPMDGNPRPTVSVEGGHWMTITGTTEDGHFIVSSWGYEWKVIGGTPNIPSQDGGLIFVKIGG